LTLYQIWRKKKRQACEENNMKDNSKKAKYHAIPSDITAMASAAMHERVALAIDLALQAGSNMVSYCNEKGTRHESSHDLGISFKTSPQDFCTKVDVENERLVTNGILQAFPSDIVIGEEATSVVGTIPPLTKEHSTWIIDPIDGTTNFAAGLPLTCVSIGYCEGGQPVMGVVYAPMTQELYVAVKGIGAFRNGVRISRRCASKNSNNNNNNTTIKLSQALVCFELGYPRDKESVTKTVGAVQRIMEHGCRASRQLGSGVLDLCYVASGRLDAVYAGLAGEGK
jgi:fructose-1,6-bisphosphatase/inositol monophosphatase family enzyme